MKIATPQHTHAMALVKCGLMAVAASIALPAFSQEAPAAPTPTAAPIPADKLSTPPVEPAKSDAPAPMATPDAAGQVKPDPTKKLEESLGTEPGSKPYYAVAGEGKTLPGQVMRVRLVNQAVSGTYGYDADGAKNDLGVKINVGATAGVIEYGVTDSISIQLLAPYIISNKAGLDADKFRSSDTYKNKYNEFIGAFAAKLAAGGLCSSVEACASYIESTNYSPAKGTAVTLPSGETYVAPGGVGAKDIADSLIVGAATQSAGTTGLGDLETGILWNIYGDYGKLTGQPLFLSAGLGVRWPTGKYKDVPSSQRSTGRGTTDLGFRFNLDFAATEWLMLSWQHQLEKQLVKGKKAKASYLDPDSTLDTVDFERVGARNKGFAQAAIGLGVISQSVRMLGFNASFNYDFDAATKLDGVQSERSRSYSWTNNFVFDGLAYRDSKGMPTLPLAIELFQTLPMGGKNSSLATTIYGLTLKGYASFR